MKRWKRFDDECINCGESPVYIYTDSDEDNCAYEDDEAKCGKCGKRGIIIVEQDIDGDGIASVIWNEINIDKE